LLYRHLSPEDRVIIRNIRERGERVKRGKWNSGGGAKGGKKKNPRRNKSEYIALWKEEDLVDGKVTESLAVVIQTGGCAWSKKGNCSMCGYFIDSSASEGSNDPSLILDQFTSVMERHKDERFLKIYTSGSFLDPNEVPREVQKSIMKSAGEKFDRVLVESRPEFIKRAPLEELGSHVDLEVAIGLESAHNDVLSHSINKGFSFENYLKAGTVLNSLDIPLRTYLILKPPFMTEGEAIRDARDSIRKTEVLSATISINPMNIQNFTFVEYLFRRGEYQPPYLWSLLEVLKTPADARLMSAPSGGGSFRGVHNCGECDKAILQKIKEFSLSQDIRLLDHQCACREEWLDLSALEDAVQVSLR